MGSQTNPAGTSRSEHYCRASLQHFPSLAERLDHVESITSLKATGPLAVESSTADVNRCLLIGDALGYVDGITGEGVSVALKQAEHLGKELPQILEAPVVCAQRLKHLSLGLRTMYRETVPPGTDGHILIGICGLTKAGHSWADQSATPVSPTSWK